MAEKPSASDEKAKKNNFKVIAIIIGIFLLIGIAGSSSKDNNQSPSATATPASTETSATATPEATPVSNVPKEYENALKKAESYLSWTSFSEKGLREQLEYDKFESAAIDYAMKNIEVDWKEQAVKKAKDYYENMSMSKDGVYDQLIFEKYTEEQVKYGVSKL